MAVKMKVLLNICSSAGEDELTLEHVSGNNCALIPEADFLRTARPIESAFTSDSLMK